MVFWLTEQCFLLTMQIATACLRRARLFRPIPAILEPPLFPNMSLCLVGLGQSRLPVSTAVFVRVACTMNILDCAGKILGYLFLLSELA